MPQKTFTLVKFNPKRTYGIELEFGQGSDRNFLKRCIAEANEPAVTSEWRHDSNNAEWVCKTDSSCGFEIASRVFGSNRSIRKTLDDLKPMEAVAQVLQRRQAEVTDRCGFHVHVCVGDMDDVQLTRLLSYWVKFEYFLVNTLPARRKRNTYCPLHSSYLSPIKKFDLRELLRRGFHQRGALNWGWYESRKTVEIRIAEGTSDPEVVKNWVRFLLYCIERVTTWPEPENVNWLTLHEALKLLDFYNDPNDNVFRILSPALTETKKWVLDRIHKHAGYRDAAEVKRIVKQMIRELH